MAVMSSDLPLKHWLYVLAPCYVVGAIGGVIVRGVPMAVNWWLMRDGYHDAMQWVELTDGDR
jgi:hypothetical protein